MPIEFSESQIELWRQQGRMEAIKEARRLGYEKWAVKNHKLAKRMRITRADVLAADRLERPPLSRSAKDNPGKVRIGTLRRSIIRVDETCSSYLEMLEDSNAM